MQRRLIRIISVTMFIIILSFIILVFSACSSKVHQSEQQESTPITIEIPIIQPDPGCKDIGFPQTYDAIIDSAYKKHFPNALLDRPCLLRAQLAKESSLNPEADSSHALGIGQQIPAVADECRSGGLIGTRVDPRFSANCAAYKDNRNWEFWTSNRTVECCLLYTSDAADE